MHRLDKPIQAIWRGMAGAFCSTTFSPGNVPGWRWVLIEGNIGPVIASHDMVKGKVFDVPQCEAKRIYSMFGGESVSRASIFDCLDGYIHTEKGE